MKQPITVWLVSRLTVFVQAAAQKMKTDLLATPIPN